MSENNGSGSVPGESVLLTVAFLDEKTTEDVVLPVLSERVGQTIKVRIRTVSFGDIAGDMPNMQAANSESTPETDPDAWVRWGNHIIERSLLLPKMTIDEIERLNDDRTILVNAILDLNGFTKKAEEHAEGEAPRDEPFREPSVSEDMREDLGEVWENPVASRSDDGSGSDVRQSSVVSSSAIESGGIGEP